MRYNAGGANVHGHTRGRYWQRDTVTGLWQRAVMKTRLSICRKKARYSTQAEAERAAEAAPFRARTYLCDRCRQYHLTSRTKGKRTPGYEVARVRET